MAARSLIKTTVCYWVIAAAMALTCLPTAHAGTSIGGEIVGLNFNNSYADSDTKTDWQGLSIDDNDTVLQTLDDLGMTVGGNGYRNYRIGFSRAMASDPADLNQWLDTVESVINAGNQVMVAGWFQGDISDPVGDAVHWKTVVDAIDARGLMSGISGWELQNEPAASNSGWRDYVRSAWKKVGPHGSTGWQNLTTQQKADTAAAWYDKPIVVQGTIFGQRFHSTLVDGLTGANDLPNLVWSVHNYAKFANTTTENEGFTVEQWKQLYLDRWADEQSNIGNNYIVTELGINDGYDKDLTGMGPAGTTTDNRKDTGFGLAAAERYGEGTGTTVFWYTAYNVASIGVGNTWESAWRTNNIHATNLIFNGSDTPDAPAGFTNVALGKPVTVDSTNGSNVGANAVDGNRSDSASRWVSTNSSPTHWITIDLQGMHLLDELRFFMGNNQYEKASADFKLQRKFRGNWVDVLSVTGNNNPVFIGDISGVTANEVRFLSTQGHSDDYLRLFEIEVYGAALQPGDFNASFDLDGGDVDTLYAEQNVYAILGIYDDQFDLDNSNSITQADVDYLVQTLGQTTYGDTGFDKKVSLLDLNTLGANFGTSGGWAQGDFNGDGQITLLDLNTLGANFGFDNSGGVFSPGVPEPASLALLIAGGLIAFRRPR